jgi:hypothetical protein
VHSAAGKAAEAVVPIRGAIDVDDNGRFEGLAQMETPWALGGQSAKYPC